MDGLLLSCLGQFKQALKSERRCSANGRVWSPAAQPQAVSKEATSVLASRKRQKA